MISTKQYKEVTLDVNESSKIFESLKNGAEYTCEHDTEVISMLLAEFDATIDSYCQFEFTIVKDHKDNVVEKSPGLILQSETGKFFIIFSRHLYDNKKIAEDVCDQLQLSEVLPIELSVIPPGGLSKDILVRNVDFLYHHATLSRNHEDFLKISSLLDLYSEATIGQLKKHVAETSIHQLLFFHGLRADLENALISDEMVVNASPLINSIIKNLEEHLLEKPNV